ncbi:MAG: AraC family transcriptional regulator [Lachnospiraceae bacterium]
MAKKRKKGMEFRYYKMPDDSPILALLGQKWIQTYGANIDYLHFHNYLEIGYCYEGNGEIILGEKEYRFSGGQFTIIPKNYPHTTNSDRGTLSRWEFLFIDVEGFLRNAYRGERNAKRVEHMIEVINQRAVFKNVKDDPKVAGLIRDILEIMRGSEEMYLEEAKAILLALLINLSRINHVNEIGIDDKQESAKLSEKAVEPVSFAMDYIAYHYMEPIRIKELADVCHVSETHFRRIFAEYMKMSPLEYVNLVRIRSACECLKKTDEPIADIAHKCGFPILSTFNRNFKQIMGVAPHEWRKRPENYEQQLFKFEIHSHEGW